MPKAGLTAIFVFLFFQVNFCQAQDIKDLHNRADKITYAEALKNAQVNATSLSHLYVLGLTCLNQHKDNEAKEAFSKMLALDKASVEAKWGIAEVLRRKHHLDESEKALNEIIKINPQFSPAYISLAYIRYIRLDFKSCLNLAYQVIRRGDKNVDISNYVRAYLLAAGAKGMLAHYGGILAKILNGTSVLSTLKKAEKLQPDKADVLLALGSFYLLAPNIAGGNINKAKDYLERAQKRDPYFADTYVRLAQVYKVKGNLSAYKRYLDKALSLDAQNELALDIKNNQCRFVCVGSD